MSQTIKFREFKPRVRKGLLIKQLFKILANGEDEGIRWRKDGLGFTIHDNVKFYNETLTKYLPKWTKIKFDHQIHQYYFKFVDDEKPYISQHNEKFNKQKPSQFIQSRTQTKRRQQRELKYPN